MIHEQPKIKANIVHQNLLHKRGTKFYQQKLPAWRPNLTSASTTIPTMIVIGLLFICIGMAVHYTSNGVSELTVEYTDCQPDSTQLRISYRTCSEYIALHVGHRCYCNVKFELTDAFVGTVYMYYGLSNFYQNHRLYVMSKDINQLAGGEMSGQLLTVMMTKSNCYPYVGDVRRNVVYAPCGLIANSLFNDTLTLTYTRSRRRAVEVPLLNTGIAWTTDKLQRFHNPPDGFVGTAAPFNWHRPVYELDLHNASNNGYKNEDLIVWMRAAAFPSFRKLYRLIDHSPSAHGTAADDDNNEEEEDDAVGLELFANGLPAGNYTLTVGYAFPVKVFNGHKTMILATTSWIGGKNAFLSNAYLWFGVCCVLFSLLLAAVHVKYAFRSAVSFEFYYR